MNIHSWLNHIKPEQGFKLQGSNAARTTDWIGMAGYRSIVFVLHAEEGAADDDIVVKFKQAKTNAGGDSKAIVPRKTYLRSEADLSAAAATGAITAADGAAAGITIEGSQQQILAVEFDASELDDDFKYLQLTTDAGGAAGKVIGCLALACGPYYAGAPENLASAVA